MGYRRNAHPALIDYVTHIIRTKFQGQSQNGHNGNRQQNIRTANNPRAGYRPASSPKGVLGKKHGPWVEYWGNGNLQGKGTYKDGKREGPWVRYHDYGQLEFKGDYKGGKFDSPWVTYHVNGQIISKDNSVLNRYALADAVEHFGHELDENKIYN